MGKAFLVICSIIIKGNIMVMDKEMAALTCQTADKLDAMSDADFAAQQFHFTDE